VDFEVPTPAVVKEGSLAPYRSLVYFCQPSPRELQYLRGIQEHFETAIAQVTGTAAFQDWLRQTIFVRRPADAPPDTPPEPFAQLLDREPVLCTAAVKALLAQGVALPSDVTVVEEMLEPLQVDDWLALLENFALRVLKVSYDPALHNL